MSAIFDDVRLPPEVEQGSTGGPTFFTSVLRLSSGAEARNQNWQQQKMVYDIAYGITSSEDGDASNFYAVMNFFYARRGRLRGFRFKDWTDYQAFVEPCAMIDPLHYQLQKTYTSGVAFSRKITRPVVGTVVLLDANDAPLTGYQLDPTTGIVTFAADQTVVSWTGEFDVPVRFDTDVFTLTIQLFNAAEIQSLNLVELL